MYSLYSCLHFTLNSASGARFFLPSFLPQRDSREHLVPRQQRLASILKEAEAATVAKGRKEEEEEEEALGWRWQLRARRKTGEERKAAAKD
jgi:hypothetical protein